MDYNNFDTMEYNNISRLQNTLQTGYMNLRYYALRQISHFYFV